VECSKRKEIDMARAIDLGTSNILAAKDGPDGTVEVKSIRNCFLALEDEPFQEAMLENSPDANYVKKDGKLYVLGDFALPLGPAMKESVRRPMWCGMLNRREPQGSAMLKIMATQLIGPPSAPGEILAMTCPESPMDDDTLDVTFHRQITVKWFEEMGYVVRPINEAVAVGYEMVPCATTPSGDLPLTGVAISMGGGMTNGVPLVRGMPLTPFSIAKGGDYIDRKAHDSLDMAVEKICLVKEKMEKLADGTIRTVLDLSTSDQPDIRMGALYIYYEEIAGYVVDMLNKVLAEDQNNKIEDPCEIVVAGGVASPRGFSTMFKKVCDRKKMMFPVKGVRVSEDPIRCIVKGALKIAKLEERRAAKEKASASQK
jgi:hypothetical protein